MEEILKQILGKVSAMEEGQNKLIQRMDKLDSEISTIKEDMATKENISRLESKVDKIAGSGEEDTVSLIKLMDKKMDTLATKKDIDKLNAKFEVLNSRLFHQEAELYELKAVK